ncbi:MAG: protein adenylyltransferase SelO [Burkholderiales bacterium]
MSLPPTVAPWSESLRWTHRFASLGPAFYTEIVPQGLPDPHWIAHSPWAAQLLGWPTDWWSEPSGLAVFSGQVIWPSMRPLASVYSGHQFGVWAGQLGDGRALWLGEVETPSGPMELQLKGAGRTPYSRRGDGRAVWRSSIREFLCSEALAGLGIPTTRALCITGSRLTVQRETLEPAAIVTRVSPSFIRFGHFEHFSYSGQHKELKALADFVIRHYCPECALEASPYAALLKWVAQNTAELIASWQAVGFCHGVMNTDNMSILGLTLDYGPFGFLDAYRPEHICNHSDHQGRYAYDQQPTIASWNLYALGQALMPLIQNTDTALAALETYQPHYSRAWAQRLRAKLGLQTALPQDLELAQSLLQLMADNRVDFTILFRRLCSFDSTPQALNESIRALFMDQTGFDQWAQHYKARLSLEPGGGSPDQDRARMIRMRQSNPWMVLRNHLAQTAIEAAQQNDFSEIERLLEVVVQPFEEAIPSLEAHHFARYAGFPPDWAQQLEVSCSS